MSQTTFLVTPGAAISTDTGAPAGAGDQVKADPKNPYTARLVRDGRLVEVAPRPKTRSKTKTEDK